MSKDKWLSPVLKEREWQEEQLKKLFPSYPDGCPKWQYLNGLIMLATKTSSSFKCETL